MRTRIRFASILCAPLLFGLLAGCDANDTHVLRPSDTYVSAQAPTENFSRASDLGVKTDSVQGVQAVTLMSFPTASSGVTASDLAAGVLRVHVNASPTAITRVPLTLKVFSVENFSADQVTWKSRPLVKQFISTNDAPDGDNWINFDVTPTIRSALAASQNVYFAISSETPGLNVTLTSMESNANFHPGLILFGNGASASSSTSSSSTSSSSTSTSSSSTSTSSTSTSSTSTSSTSTSTSSTTTTSPGGSGLRCSNPTRLTGYEGTKSYPPYLVQQDVWAGVGQQTMDVCGADNWKATVNQSGEPASGVKTYPDSAKTYTDWQTCASQPAVSSFSNLTSTYAETAPGSGSYDYAYDIFIGGGHCGPFHEIMIWNDWRDISVPNAQDHPTISGVQYDFYHNANASYLQFRMVNHNSSGSVNLLAIFNYLESQGLLSGSDGVVFIQYGVEVLTTFGHNTDFYLNDFSVTDH